MTSDRIPIEMDNDEQDDDSDDDGYDEERKRAVSIEKRLNTYIHFPITAGLHLEL